MGNLANKIDYEVDLAAWLATVEGDGTLSDLFEDQKLDDPTYGEQNASQIDTNAGHRWGDIVDDLVRANHEVHRGVRRIGNFAVAGGLAADADALARNLVVGRKGTTVNAGISILATTDCRLAMGRSASLLAGGLLYANGTDQLSLIAGGQGRATIDGNNFVPNVNVVVFKASATVALGNGDGTAGSVSMLATSSSGPGALLDLLGGDAHTTGAGGGVRLRGKPGVGSNQNGGDISFEPGARTGSGTPGRVIVYTAGAADGISAVVQAQPSAASGSGSILQLAGGVANTTGKGGGIRLVAQPGVGSNQDGGDCELAPGAATGSGVTGSSLLKAADGTTKVRVNNTGIGFFGVTPVAQQADIVALTDNTGGTADNTCAAMPNPADAPATADALRDDIVANLLPPIRNNFADLIDQINLIRTALRNLGLMA